MAVDFRSLLSTPLDSIKRPPSLPAGVAYGKITGHKYDESRFADQETGQKHAVVIFTVRVERYDESVDASMLNGIDLTKRTLTREMPLSGGNEYVTKAFLEGLGIATSGASWDATIPQTTGADVMFEVTQRPDKNDPERVYNDIRALRAAQ